MDGDGLDEPLPLVEFTPSAGAMPASNSFSGSLRFPGDDASMEFSLLVDDLNAAAVPIPGMRQLPPFDFEFVQADGHLVPVDAGPIPSDHAWWEFILEPGPVWDDARDAGYSRAALPFSLKERNADCIHNGLMTFLFRDDGAVSNVAYQISHQTCMYLQFEMRGLSGAVYEQHDVKGETQAIDEFERVQRGRISQRPIAQLATDYPGSDPGNFGSEDEISPQDMTVFGFVIDGVHYVGGCATPYGDYPYCDEMALPSYSTAKTLVGGLGLMRAEKLYPGVAAEMIEDYVPECGEEWRGVTFEHVLDMATGKYDSAVPFADEDGAILADFFVAEDHATKIHAACNYAQNTEPGISWVYHTKDTYLLGTALIAFLREASGPDADLYRDLIVADLWVPLGLSRLTYSTRRTRDSVAQPFSGWGLSFHRDDVAKIVQFLGESDGRLNGVEVLDQVFFDNTKRRNPEDPGLPSNVDLVYYNNGARTRDVSEMLGCENLTLVTTLSGFGGINFVLMPNDSAYYYFSDAGVHSYLQAIRESHRIRPMCQENT
jgi:hypothetical protein